MIIDREEEQNKYPTEEQMLSFMKAPLQFYKEKDELTQLKERWTSLIRNVGFKVVKDHGPGYMCSPDLFDVANEIDAFFTGLKSKK